MSEAGSTYLSFVTVNFLPPSPSDLLCPHFLSPGSRPVLSGRGPQLLVRGDKRSPGMLGEERHVGAPSCSPAGSQPSLGQVTHLAESLSRKQDCLGREGTEWAVPRLVPLLAHLPLLRGGCFSTAPPGHSGLRAEL